MGRRPSPPLPRHNAVLRVASGRLLTELGTTEPIIRSATPDDLDAIGVIYAHHVLSQYAYFQKQITEGSGDVMAGNDDMFEVERRALVTA